MSQGELKYQRESHRRLNARLARVESFEVERGRLTGELEAAVRRGEGLETERDRVLAENELLHARIADLFASNEEYHRRTAAYQAEIERLTGILSQIYRSRTWKLHLLAERLRGR